MANVAKIDENTKPALTAVSSSDANEIVPLYADPVTHRLLVDLVSGGTTTVDAGTTTTLPAGDPATVVNSGTTTNAVFDFGIPVAKLTDTSVTSNSIGLGSKVFSVTASNNGWVAGDWLMISRQADPSVYMTGYITAYTGPSVTVTIIKISAASGPFTDWNIALSGAIGADGDPIVWLGNYNAGTTYQPLDAVFYPTTGSSYVCTANTLNHLPTDTAFWDLMAEKGADGAGSGTVTTVSVTTANGVSGTVANASTTPAISLTLGDITPSKVNGNIITTGTGTITITGTKTLTVSDTATVSGTNTGDDKTGVTGILKGNGTTISAATAGVDYIAPPAGTSILKGNSGGALANATAGTDYSAGTAALGTGILKSTNGTGALSIAVSGTDFKTVNSTSILGSGNIVASVINWLGAWDSVAPYTIYNPNDAVSYAGSSYICILQTTAAGEDPTNLTYWNPLAVMGNPGPAGVSGSLDFPFTNGDGTTIVVAHNFNARPVVSVYDNTGAQLIPVSVTNTDLDTITVVLATAIPSGTGHIVCTIGGTTTTVVSKAADYTLLDTDNMVLVTAACTIKLPALPASPSLAGKTYYIKDMAASGINVIVSGNGSTIDGEATLTLVAQYTTLSVFTDNTYWYII